MIRHRNSGVTLIEVNLAMGVMLFGVLSVSSLFPVGLKLVEQGCLSSDCDFITVMARSQTEMLSTSSGFKFAPLNTNPGQLEGRLNEDPPKTGTFKGPISCIRIKDGSDQAKMDWKANDWVGAYMLMTGGGEAGRIFPITANDGNRLTLSVSIAGSRIRKFDSFRIICNKTGTPCIPSAFLGDSDSGRTIPSINGLLLKENDGDDDGPEYKQLSDVRKSTASALSDLTKKYKNSKGLGVMSYAVVLDSPKPGSPGLYRAYVLIYKDYTDDTKTPWATETPVGSNTPIFVNPKPAEYVPFFYRKPSLLN